ncbi:MAG: SRPBCC family protein [Chloroflexota bacterium]
MQVHIETEINAPAEKVWQILAHQFADMADWTTTLSESRVVEPHELPKGLKVAASAPIPARETTSSFAKAIEVISDYSERDMELTFEAANLPPFLSTATNTQRVTARGNDKCLLTFDMNLGLKGVFKILGPVLKRRFQNTMGGVQRELKVFAETGKVAIA